MSFFRRLFGLKGPELDVLTIEYLNHVIEGLEADVKDLDAKVKELEKEVCHWKHLALTFKKHL